MWELKPNGYFKNKTNWYSYSVLSSREDFDEDI